MMDTLGTHIRAEWNEEEGDYILRAHMQHNFFGVNRERAPEEQHMDGRAFSLLMWRVAKAAKEGTATYADARKCLDRIVDAGLAPSYFDFVALLDAASGKSTFAFLYVCIVPRYCW